MKPTRLLFATLVIALGAATARAVPAWAHDLHFGLQRSAPAKDAKVADVREVRLWFTQVPQEGSASVRLVDRAGEQVETSELTSDPNDGKIVYVSLEHPLAAGSYTVAWRGIGDDGHVVRGDFSFSVTAAQ